MIDNATEAPSAVGRNQRRQRLRLAATACLLSAAVSTALALGSPVIAQALDLGVPVTTGFPRLSMWSPDTNNQSRSDVARYDYIVLYDGQADAIPDLRAANPDIVILNLSSAGEVALDHWLISQIPNEWFLPQVGTWLSARVDATTTTFPVKRTAVFAPNQIVSIDQELVEVVSVNASSITVKRGLKLGGDNAKPHGNGALIQPLVTRHYRMIDMDLSTNCPRVDVDPTDTIGSETWGEYMARVTADRCKSAAWDGVAVDRVENSESFLTRKSYAAAFVKSIDAKRKGTNEYVTDNYKAFDAAWVAGVRHHLETIRAKLGTHRIVIANNGAFHYDLINGSNMESFPRFDDPVTTGSLDAYVTWWTARRTFYTNWAKNGLQPNFSTLMTYYYEPEPPADGTLVPKGAMTSRDYQKLRFSLGTALLDNGFFTYQLRVWGNRIGTFWFDEYDNAGKKDHYLGMPTGSVRLALPTLKTTDRLRGDGYMSTSAKFHHWTLYKSKGYSAEASRPNNTARVTITHSGKSPVGVLYYHSNHGVKKNAEYTVRFRARATRASNIRVRLATPSAPWADWLGFYTVPLTTAWKTYEFSGHSSGSDSDARLVFDLGGTTRSVWIDDVKFQSGSRLDVYRRDFQGGTVIVNVAPKRVTVPLGKTLRKIRGTQAPTINTGATVNSVSIAPRDAIILLNPATN